MSEKTKEPEHEQDTGAEQENPGQIIITFDFEGAATFSASWANVNPLQMLAVGRYLQGRGMFVLEQQWADEAIKKAVKAAQQPKLVKAQGGMPTLQ
jgi:hypothetical protein